MSLAKLKKEIREKSSKEKSKIYAKFFKTGKGEYGEGDIFLGLTVPEQRILARKYTNLVLDDVKKLLESKYHEHRLMGLFILVYKYERSNEKEKAGIKDFYLENKHRGNNWDLVDSIAGKIIGKHLIDKDKKVLYELAKSESIWDRRIAIISTFEFIKNGKFEDTLKISKILLKDEHDLIHKAVGWMLREIGKRDLETLEKFLKRHYKKMPRTMLRYAIEKFPEIKRKKYLAGKI